MIKKEVNDTIVASAGAMTTLEGLTGVENPLSVLIENDSVSNGIIALIAGIISTVIRDFIINVFQGGRKNKAKKSDLSIKHKKEKS